MRGLGETDTARRSKAREQPWARWSNGDGGPPTTCPNCRPTGVRSGSPTTRPSSPRRPRRCGVSCANGSGRHARQTAPLGWPRPPSAGAPSPASHRARLAPPAAADHVGRPARRRGQPVRGRLARRPAPTGDRPHRAAPRPPPPARCPHSTCSTSGAPRSRCARSCRRRSCSPTAAPAPTGPRQCATQAPAGVTVITLTQDGPAAPASTPEPRRRYADCAIPAAGCTTSSAWSATPGRGAADRWSARPAEIVRTATAASPLPDLAADLALLPDPLSGSAPRSRGFRPRPRSPRGCGAA